MIHPEVKIKKILYATDLSEGGRQAFAYAISLANTYNAAIKILHVLPGTVGSDVARHIVGYIGEENWQKIKKSHYDNARSVLISKQQERSVIKEALRQFSESFKDEGGSQYATTDEIIIEESQNPVEVILKQADQKNCDLIVMGTRGLGIIAEALVGSTTRGVIRHSKKPVLVIPIQQSLLN